MPKKKDKNIWMIQRMIVQLYNISVQNTGSGLERFWEGDLKNGELCRTKCSEFFEGEKR